MDSRILFEHCLGLHPGDAHMIRNAGGIATDDAIRSLIVSHHLLDTQEFIIINHTDCGLLKVREDELKARLTEKMGTAAAEPSHFHAFDDLEVNVRQQMQRVKSHPWIPKHIPVRGFVYDVKTGRLREVMDRTEFRSTNAFRLSGARCEFREPARRTRRRAGSFRRGLRRYTRKSYSGKADQP